MAGSVKEAWRAYRSGDEQKASDLFEKLTANGSASAHSFIQRGLFKLKLNQFTEASSSFEEAGQKAPDNAAPFFFLALSQELGGQSEKSSETLAKLRELSPHHQGISSLELLRALRSGDPLPHLQGFGFGPERSLDQQPTVMQRMAASLGSGDPSWLPADLSSSDYLLGPILLEVERRLHPLEVPKLEHHEPLLPENLEEVVPEKRTFREELDQLWNSTKAGPLLKKGKTAFERSYGLQDKEKQRELLNKAARYLRLSRKIDPYGFRVSYHLGETYSFLARQEGGVPCSRFKLIQAQNCFLESSRKEGVNPYLLFYLAYIQHLLGRPLLGIKYYREATTRFEKLPEAHYGEGQCELLLGNEQRAKELFLRAVNSDLTLAKERLDLFANLLAENGPEHFERPFPKMPPEPVAPEVPEDETTEAVAIAEQSEESAEGSIEAPNDEEEATESDPPEESPEAPE